MLETSLTKRNEIEQTILALAMHEAGGEICMRISGDMFAKDNYRVLFNAINDLITDGMVPDAMTLYNHCQAKSINIQMRFLLDLYDFAPPKENAPYYIEKMVENSQLERLKTFACGVMDVIDRADLSPNEIITQKNEEFFEIGIKDPKIKICHVSEAVEDVISLAKTAADRGRVGINTGFPLLDKLTMGLQNEYLILIAGRPSVGKTALMLNMIEHMTLKNNHPALLISLEMGAPSLLQRTISRKMDVSTYKIRSGNLEEHEWALMSKIGGNMTSQPFYIADAPSATIPQITTMSRQAVKQFGAEVIFIDYLQLISVQGRTRNEEVGYISASLKQLARELKIPVVALSQLSRAGETKIPKLSDLRDSGALEQDADQVIFVNRGRNKRGQLENEGTLIIAKARNERTGVIDVLFDPEKTRFLETEEEYASKETTGKKDSLGEI